MANETEDRTEATAPVAAEFHVPLEPNASSSVFVESEDEDADETEATEPAAEEETPEPVAAAEEEAPTPPTAEELGVDTSTAEGKRQFKALLTKWNTWQTRFNSKHAKTPDPAPQETQPPAVEQTAQTGEQWDAYVIPAYTGDREPEDSVLSGAEDAIDRRINQGIKHALDAMRQNDARLREQQQHQTVAEKLNAFGAAISTHPELETRKDDIIQFVKDTEAVAQKNPERWMKLFKSEFGFGADWKDELADDTATVNADRGQINRRLADKPRQSVPRPTNGARALAGQPRGNLSLNQAFDKVWDERARR